MDNKEVLPEEDANLIYRRDRVRAIAREIAPSMIRNHPTLSEELLVGRIYSVAHAIEERGQLVFNH